MKNANPVSRLVGWGLVLALALAACGKQTPARIPSVPALPAATGADGPIVRYTYELVRSWPHDPGAFTQGLVFRNGGFLESTGEYGESTLREVELATGRVLKQVALGRTYFGEGLAVIGAKAFQLTWRNQRGFVYDADTFQLLGDFRYEGEGWGLTDDGTHLYMSDGTAQIRVIDPTNFGVVRRMEVRAAGQLVERVNELEFVRGELFANVWQSDEILRIDAATGRVRGVVDLRGLLPAAERGPRTSVLNGIAYDTAGDRLYVTGKRWPKIYEIRLRAQ